MGAAARRTIEAIPLREGAEVEPEAVCLGEGGDLDALRRTWLGQHQDHVTVVFRALLGVRRDVVRVHGG